MYLVVFTYKYGCTVWPVSDDRHDAREGGWTWCPACARGPVMAHIGRNNSPLEKTVKTDKIYIYQKKYNELCKNNGDGSPLYGISRFSLDICCRLRLQIRLIVQVLVTEPNREPRVNRGRARRCDPSFFRSFREKELFQPVV